MSNYYRSGSRIRTFQIICRQDYKHNAADLKLKHRSYRFNQVLPAVGVAKDMCKYGKELPALFEDNNPKHFCASQ